MSTPSQAIPIEESSADEPVDPAEVPPGLWYDRSSLVGDFMVMIDGQTEGDFLRYAPENRTCEFIDGIVYMPSPATLEHQFDNQILFFLLEGFTGERRSGIVLTGPAAVRLRPDCLLEPDAFVLPFDCEQQMHGIYCEPPLLIVVEVLSRSNRSHDLSRKSALYREAGVPEVYFIDDRDGVVIVERNADGATVTDRVETGPVISRALPGFWFDASWLWASPRPNLLQCLVRILAGPPA